MMFVLAFIRVYRVIFDLLFLMVNSTGCCFVLLKKSSFLMVSGQLILIMFLGYLFKKMWTDFLHIKCCLQVSDSFRSTGIMLAASSRLPNHSKSIPSLPLPCLEK